VARAASALVLPFRLFVQTFVSSCGLYQLVFPIGVIDYTVLYSGRPTTVTMFQFLPFPV
jgi:hypothetical protein